MSEERSEKLRNLYDTCKALILDSSHVVEEVEKYRLDFKPPRTSVVILAESHAHTTQKEFRRLLKDNFRHYDGSRCRYVNYVYCIGNSESYALEREYPTRRRTSQYWRILYSCLHQVSNNSDFHEFEGGESKDRVGRKQELIRNLKNNGIWLLDSSLIGVNILAAETRKQIIGICWETWLKDLISQLKNEGLLCVMTVGASVHEMLSQDLKEMGLAIVKLDQPQNRLKGGYWKNYKRIYDACERYGLK